jgi:hypothetical protein
LSVIAIKGSPRYPDKSVSKKSRFGAAAKKERAKRIVLEEKEILTTMETLTQKMHTLDNHFNNTTNPELIDCCIYETKAAHARYQYYLKQCKERGIRAEWEV